MKEGVVFYYGVITQPCIYLYTPDLVNSIVENTCNNDNGNTGRLSAGNLFSASIEEDNDDVGTTMNFIFLCVSLFCSKYR